MDTTLTLLKEEINKTQDAEHDLAKWKLGVTAALGAAAFGLSKDNSPIYWLLFLVPFVCAYVDLYDYQYRFRTLVIAKFIRENPSDPILQSYEKTCEAVRKKHVFDIGRRAAISSSIGASVFGPLFYFLNPAHSNAPNTLLVSPRFALVIWFIGVLCVIALYLNFLYKEKKLL